MAAAQRLGSVDLGVSSDGLIGGDAPSGGGAAGPAQGAIAENVAIVAGGGAIGELPATRAAPQTPNRRHVGGGAEWAYRECRTARDAQGLGLDIVEDDDGLKVTGIVPGGAADKTGQWRVGDVIVSVNGVLFGRRPAAEKIELLRTAEGEARFGVIAHTFADHGAGAGFQGGAATVATEYFFDDGLVEKGEDGFGLDIAVVDDEGVLLTAVVPGGAADRAGFLRPNDRIVMINDKPVLGLSRLEVVDRLRELNGSVKFSILAANHLHPRHRTDDVGGTPATPDTARADNSGRTCVVS